MYKKYIIFALFICTVRIRCVDIGSDTAVQRFNNQVELDDGDRIAYFAAIDGGFAFNLLDSLNVRASFDSFFPATGTIAINGGTLVLDKDLIFNEVTSITTLGNIEGNNHVLQLPAVPRIPAGGQFNCSVYFVDEISGVAGNPETMDWSYDEKYIASASDNGDLQVFSFDGSTIMLVDTFDTGGAAGGNVGDVRWHPFKYFIGLARGLSTTDDEVQTFSFDATTNTIIRLDQASLTAEGNSFSWMHSGTAVAVGTDVSDAQLQVFPITDQGILGTPVTASTLANPFEQCVSWNPTGQFIAVGLLTNADAELVVFEYNGSSLVQNTSMTPDIGRDVVGVDWNPVNDTIVVGLAGTTGDNIQVYRHDGVSGSMAGSLALVDGADDIGRTTEGVDWSPDGSCIVATSDESGGTATFNTYYFANDTLSLITNLDISVAGGIDFESAKWGPLGEHVAFAGDDNIIRVYATPLNKNCIFSDIHIFQKADIELSECTFTFTGSASTINGRSGRLTMSDSSAIVVGSNTELTFKDITLLGINGSIIRNIDDTAKIIFDNVRMILDGNYSFTVGAFDVHNRFIIEGDGHTFNFQTDQSCAIISDARLTIQDGVTFNYDPSTASKVLLSLQDETASMLINGATFATGSTGIQLTKGTVFIEGDTIFDNDGASLADAIDFGDGADASNNLSVEWLPAAMLEVQRGVVRNRNV